MTLSLLAVGFLVGLRHALEADHLAAVAALAAGGASRGEALRVAGAWGIGHGGVLVAAAVPMALLRRGVPEIGQTALEALAGAVLLLLGIDVLRRARRRGVHFHAHGHEDGTRHVHAHGHEDGTRHVHAHGHEDGTRHVHAHGHEDGTRHVHAHGHEDGTRHVHAHGHEDGTRHVHAHGHEDGTRHAHVPRPLARALTVGGIHGLAGSAVIGFVALDGLAAALGYALLLGLGSTAGMLVLTAGITLPLGRVGGFVGGPAPVRPWRWGGLEALAGLASAAVGSYWLGSALLAVAAR